MFGLNVFPSSQLRKRVPTINVSDHKQLNVIGSGKRPNHASCLTSPDVNEPYAHRRCASDERLIFSTITRCYDKRVTVFAVAIVAGDMEVLYGKFT